MAKKRKNEAGHNLVTLKNEAQMRYSYWSKVKIVKIKQTLSHEIGLCYKIKYKFYVPHLSRIVIILAPMSEFLLC